MRYVTANFDLDLTYITPRVIGAGAWVRVPVVTPASHVDPGQRHPGGVPQPRQGCGSAAEEEAPGPLSSRFHVWLLQLTDC